MANFSCVTKIASTTTAVLFSLFFALSVVVVAHPVFKESYQLDYWQRPCPAEEAAIAAAGSAGADSAMELSKALELTAAVISSAHELRNDATGVLTEMLGGDLSAADQVGLNMQAMLSEVTGRLARTKPTPLTNVLKEYKTLLATFAREMATMFNAEMALRSGISSTLERLNFGSSGLRTLLCSVSMLELHLQPAGATRTGRSLMSTLQGGIGGGGGSASDAAISALGSNVDKVIVLKGLADTLQSMIKSIENSVASPKQ